MRIEGLCICHAKSQGLLTVWVHLQSKPLRNRCMSCHQIIKAQQITDDFDPGPRMGVSYQDHVSVASRVHIDIDYIRCKGLRISADIRGICPGYSSHGYLPISWAYATNTLVVVRLHKQQNTHQ